MRIAVTPVNDPPTISAIADRAPGHAPEGSIAFTVADVDDAPGELRVRAASSNEGVVPNAGLVLQGSGPDRLLTIVPRADVGGTAVITISVSDRVSTTTRRLVFDVECAPATGEAAAERRLPEVPGCRARVADRWELSTPRETP